RTEGGTQRHLHGEPVRRNRKRRRHVILLPGGARNGNAARVGITGRRYGNGRGAAGRSARGAATAVVAASAVRGDAVIAAVAVTAPAVTAASITAAVTASAAAAASAAPPGVSRGGGCVQDERQTCQEQARDDDSFAQHDADSVKETTAEEPQSDDLCT